MTLFKKIFFLFFAFSLSFFAAAQPVHLKDSNMLSDIYKEALVTGKSYSDLRELCKNIGSRLSGSLGEKMAIQWGINKLKSYNFDTVYTQKVMVPHWERGTKEKGYYTSKDNSIHKVTVLSLGGSVGTNGVLSGELILFQSREELKNAAPSSVEGKIVFLAEHLEQHNVNTFHAYGKGFPIRSNSAVLAAKKRAKAVLIRTLSLSENDFPNTGVMRYQEGVNKIPAVALSTQDATLLEKRLLNASSPITFYLETDCKLLPDAQSYNIIAEIKGSTYPNNIITVGGHLDSWDVGEGAHDDGAGIVHAMEALRILNKLNYQPKNTIRVVFFANEENGNKGGKVYAEKAFESNENHIYAIESDAGGFSPRGFYVDDNSYCLTFIQQLSPLFKPYLLTEFKNGWAGVCTSPLGNYFDDIGLINLITDSQRYFNIHHNANDVFETVNKRELELGAAAIASLVYLLDSKYEPNK